MLLGTALIVGILTLLLSGGDEPAEPVAPDSPYLGSLEGVMRRHGEPVPRRRVLSAASRGGGGAGEGSSAPGQAGDAGAPPDAENAASGGGEPGARAPAAASDRGRQVLQILGDPDVVVLALSGPSGSFVYHRKRGWMRETSEGWVTVSRSSLPGDLRERYPAVLYPEPRSRPENEPPAAEAADGGTEGSGEGVGPFPAAPVPVTEEDARILYLMVPSLAGGGT